MPDGETQLSGRRAAAGRRKIVLLGAAAVALLLVGVGATLFRQDGLLPSWNSGVESADASATVKVERRDVISVMAVNGEVVASPSFTLIAPVSGRFQREPTKQQLVSAGTTLGWVDHGGERVSIATPVEAAVTEDLATNGATVPTGIPLIKLKASGFGIRGTVADAMVYRLGDVADKATAQIDHGPGPFPCPVLGGPSTLDSNAVQITCAAPADLRLFPGLKAVLALQTGIARNVLTLPVDAVAGSAERGRITVRSSDGATATRDVKLGITDGSYIEITDGVSGDAEVVVPGPNLPDLHDD